ncbi:hypothetical protein NIB75_18940 [Bacteroides uniformis]|nr:hypothetical protein [Bacteroides uniformis]
MCITWTKPVEDDIRDALVTLAKRDSQTRIDAAYAEFGKMGTVLEVDAFLKTVKERFGQQEKDLDKSLWRMQDGKAVYVNDIGDRSEAVAARTYDYARYMNTQTVPEIVRAATAYRNAISSAANAHELMRKGGFDFDQFEGLGIRAGRKRAMETAGTGAERHRCAAYRQHRASQAGTYDTREVLFIAPADFRRFGGGSREHPPRGGLHSRPVRQRTGFQRYTSVCCQPDYQHASG